MAVRTYLIFCSADSGPGARGFTGTSQASTSRSPRDASSSAPPAPLEPPRISREGHDNQGAWSYETVRRGGAKRQAVRVFNSCTSSRHARRFAVHCRLFVGLYDSAVCPATPPKSAELDEKHGLCERTRVELTNGRVVFACSLIGSTRDDAFSGGFCAVSQMATDLPQPRKRVRHSATRFSIPSRIVCREYRRRARRESPRGAYARIGNVREEQPHTAASRLTFDSQVPIRH